MDDDELEELRKRRLEELKRKLEYPKKPIEVDSENFEEILSKYPLVVIDCWAEWCVPCRILEPRIIKLSEEYSGRIVFGKLNIDRNMEIAKRLGIRSIPTLLFFRNGRVVDYIVGVVPEDEIRGRLNKLEKLEK
ncbi:MAG: thioredoxin [Candidatus Altiarchaeales archaeon]|nr:MAG: thioredoxin [Candidatus Altiarchaeales archaeon]RLI93676.1 MAG: thioredoxin [Candidatus Altiarchaeales archaeon]RLI94404.1 MAG: thioredoxin [Candidatus Altiarchaeales archaeon]HDO81963.1 thioredoxin [Candidatus Altiarchaeales archaeon]HEX54612.1 thioredoxin [Candidatus Altiarchaeales archaeon]